MYGDGMKAETYFQLHRLSLLKIGSYILACLYEQNILSGIGQLRSDATR